MSAVSIKPSVAAKRSPTKPPANIPGQRLRIDCRWYAVMRLGSKGWWTHPDWFAESRTAAIRQHDTTPECGRPFKTRRAEGKARVALIELRTITTNRRKAS